MKGFYLLSTVEKLLKGTIPSLSHEADGLIFQVNHIQIFLFQGLNTQTCTHI